MLNYWQGKKVKLRALELSDLAFFFALSQDTERTRLLDWLTPPTSKAALEDWLGDKAKQEMQNFEYQWMIDTLEGQTVGSIATHTCNSRTGTFSYALDVAREFQRQGFATEAINLVLEYYFQELRFQKVTVSAASNNEASIALHKQLGFKHEGTHRRMVFSNGAYYDSEWFGLTVEEFLNLD